MVHYDRWWNPAVEDQASDRAYRIGQDRAVQIHRLISEGTLEDRIAAVLAAKRELAERVVGGGERWISELSNDDLAELVSSGEAGMTPAARSPRGGSSAGRGGGGRGSKPLSSEPASTRTAYPGPHLRPPGAGGDLDRRARLRQSGRRRFAGHALSGARPGPDLRRTGMGSRPRRHRRAGRPHRGPARWRAHARGGRRRRLGGCRSAARRRRGRAQCSCPDWADPCKHAAAVVYLMADVLDADPFALLLLRGRDRGEVLAALRRRRAGLSRRMMVDDTATGGRPPDEGVSARDAYAATDGSPPSLPAIPLPPRHPGAPVPLAVDPPPDAGVLPQDLADLAADAARRAWELCTGQGDGGLGLDPSLDLIRRAAASWGVPARTPFEATATRAGLRARELARGVAAWRLGGADAVAVLDDEWTPDGEAMDEGRAACAAVGAVRIRANRISLVGGAIQLRLGRSGAWYRFERVGRSLGAGGGTGRRPGHSRVAVTLDDPVAGTNGHGVITLSYPSIP